MNHDRLKPILQAVVACNDYGKDTNMKTDELWDRLVPLGHSINEKDSILPLYAIIHTTLGIIKEIEEKEIECTNVNVEKSISLNEA